MAYWFHRNPLKATSPVTFELSGVSTNEATRKIFRHVFSVIKLLINDVPIYTVFVDRSVNQFS